MCERFLSEGDLRQVDWRNAFPIITVGTSMGKTTFVMTNKLSERIEKDTNEQIGFTLLLVPTTMLKEDIMKKYNAEELSKEDLIHPIEDDSIIRVACFAKLADFITSGNEIANVPDLIVIDEIDCLVTWSLYFRGYIEAWDWILSKRKEMFVCGLTATSKLLDYAKRYTGIPFVNITTSYPVKHKAEEIEVIPHSSASTYLKSVDRINEENKALVYVRSARMCKSLAERYRGRAGYVVSEQSEHYSAQNIESTEGAAFGVREQSLREYLVEHEKLPPQMDILFFNDSMNVGFNIEDPKVKTVIVDSLDLAIGIQCKGRVRHNLDRFVLTPNRKEYRAFFDNYRRAEEFFDGSKSQEYLKGWYDQQKAMKGSHILVFKRSEEYRVNFFAEAIYEYTNDVFEESKRKEYFEPLNAHSDNGLVFTDADTVAENARNLSNFQSLDIAALFGLKDGETEKIVTAKELQGIAKRASLKDAKGNLLGKETFVRYVNAHSDYSLSKLPTRKVIDGRKQVAYVLTQDKNAG